MDLHRIKDCLIDHTSSIQVGLYIFIFTTLWVLEQFFSAEPISRKWRHTSLNALLIFSALPLQLVMTLLLIPLAGWVTSHHWGLLYLLPHSSSPWVKYLLIFFILDFLDYVYHRTMHLVPPFWRFHLVHHTDRKLDVSTTVREHPGETIIRNCFLFLWVFLTGAGVFVLILRQTFQSFANITSHTAFRLSPRMAKILGLLFVTPNIHHVHHHFQLPYTNSNYGDVFSIWDRLFGTLTELPAEETVHGLDTHMDESLHSNYMGIVSMPFRNEADPSTMKTMPAKNALFGVEKGPELPHPSSHQDPDEEDDVVMPETQAS